MDFNGINAASSGRFPRNISLNSLPLHEPLKIVNLCEILTKKVGRKIVAEITDRRVIFLPEKTTEYLFANKNDFKLLQKLAIRGGLSFKSLGASGMEFMIKKNEKCEYFLFLFIV